MGQAHEPIIIREYDTLISEADQKRAGFDYAATLPPAIFAALEAFLLQGKDGEEKGSEAGKFLHCSYNRSGVKIISARNYVGVIAMGDGTTIEIRPKICTVRDGKSVILGQDDQDQLQVYLDMLRTVLDIPYKRFDEASLLADKMPLLEIFIRMFLQEVTKLLRHGLKYGYVPREGNERFLRGRLDFNQQIRHNLIHKERFYVHYDEFMADRPENRLIKSTLRWVARNSKDGTNRRECRRCLDMFADVNESVNIAGDFAKYTANRNMREYEQLLKWCRVFLLRQCFTVFSGKEVAWALLFPMEKLFESYVAQKLSSYIANDNMNGYSVNAQEQRKYLFDEPRRFALRPDMVVRRKGEDRNEDKCWVLDTKWKRLYHDPDKNYGISQGDMYQMYAYQKKYACEKVVLVYPFWEGVEVKEDQAPLATYTADDSVTVEVMLFDLMHTDKSVERLAKRIQIPPNK